MATNTPPKHVNPTVALFSIGSLLFFLNLALAYTRMFWTGLGGLSSLFLAQSFLVFSLFTPLHEAVHGIASKSRRLNAFIMYALGPFFLSNTSLFRAIHLTHHAAVNQGAKDPDHFTASGSLALRWAKSFLLLPSYYVFVFKHLRHEITLARVVTSMLFPAVALICAYTFNFMPLMLIGWFLPSFFAQGILGYTFTALPHHPATETTRLRSTRIILAPKIVQWLTYQQNLHLIHHLRPNLPWYAYARYWRENGDRLTKLGAPVTIWPGGHSQLPG